MATLSPKSTLLAKKFLPCIHQIQHPSLFSIKTPLFKGFLVISSLTSSLTFLSHFSHITLP